MLTIVEHQIKDIQMGDEAVYRDGILVIDKNSLLKALFQNVSGKYNVEPMLAKPGEKKRLIHITDIIKPSHKEYGSSFPGWIAGSNKCGEGITHQTNDLCITQSFVHSDIQEGIIDMSGEGAKYSVFSQKLHLVLATTLVDEALSKEEIARDLIQMKVNAADYIGELLQADVGNRRICEKKNASLPKVGYVCLIQAQGALRNVHIYAEDCTHMKPEFMTPAMGWDGAVVSGNYIISCQKNPTYFHQDNPVVKALCEKDGNILDFIGVIYSTESSLLDEKKENAASIADIAVKKELDGIIVTQEGGGHADVDLMEVCTACEEKGIKVVLLSNELAGPQGNLPPLVAFSERADALISTGNNDQIITLPYMEEVIGTKPYICGGKPANTSMDIGLGMMYTSTNQLGMNTMRAMAY